jgi:predicted dehydrogenase
VRRGAIVGVGGVSLNAHVPGWLKRDDVTIVAATDTDAARRAEALDRIPGVRWYDSAAALLDGEALDFVDVCTPPSSHAGIIESVLDHRLHVLCEKPLVRSISELAAVVRRAAAAGRVLHTVHNWHHAPIVRRVRELVRDGAIGGLRHVTWHTLRTRPAGGRDPAGNWRVDPGVAGGGVLTDHGWHVFYVLGRWIGERPTAVSATLETRRHTQFAVEDTATVRLTYPEATAEVLLTWASDERRNYAELRGTAGSIRLEDDTVILTRPGRATLGERWSCPPALSDGSHHPDWFHEVVEQFMSALDAPPPGSGNLVEASLCVVLEALARESSRRHGAALSLEVPPAPLPAAVAGLLA